VSVLAHPTEETGPRNTVPAAAEHGCRNPSTDGTHGSNKAIIKAVQ